MRIDAVVLLDQPQHRVGLDIADHGDGRIIRPIEGVVELAQLRCWNMLDVAFPADGRMVIRQRHIGGLHDLLQQHVLRIVLAALILIADHGHFRLPVGFMQPKMAHTIGLDGDVPL